MLRVFSVRQQSQLFSITLKHVSRELAVIIYYFQQVFNHISYASALVTHDGAHFRPCSSSPGALLRRAALCRLIAIILYQGYNTLKQGLFLIKAVTALLRESHTLNKAVTAVFTSKAAARYKAVIVLRHTTALLRDPYCTCYWVGSSVLNSSVLNFPLC